MFGEMDLLGAFVPRIVAWLVTALLIFATVDWFLSQTRFYQYFWHPPLVRFALFVCLFCAGGWLVSTH
jgi:hypothetical protein